MKWLVCTVYILLLSETDRSSADVRGWAGGSGAVGGRDGLMDLVHACLALKKLVR